MKATFVLFIAAATNFSLAVANAQDRAPDLVEAVTSTVIPAVTFTLKVDGLIRPGEPGGDFGERVRRGQTFTIKDGEKLHFYDHAQRTRYEVEARLSDKPPVLWIRTTTRTGKDDGLGLAVGGSKVRVSTIPIK